MAQPNASESLGETFKGFSEIFKEAILILYLRHVLTRTAEICLSGDECDDQTVDTPQGNLPSFDTCLAQQRGPHLP